MEIRHDWDHQDLGRSRGGFGTKIHLVTDRHGIPLGAVLSPGQAHDSKHIGRALESVQIPHSGPGRPRSRPNFLAGDKGYSLPNVREYLCSRGIEPVIPTKSNQQPIPNFDRERGPGASGAPIRASSVPALFARYF